MANQLKMADIQALLALHERGWSNRRIARELSIDRETVGRHVRLVCATAANPASAPSGSAVKILPNQSVAWPWREIILEKLKQGLQAQRIYQDLTAAEHGYGGSYYSVRRLVKKLTAWTEPPVRRMGAPGAEAQVDFGRGAPPW